MSSRILRGKPVEASPPVCWRSIQQPGSTLHAESGPQNAQAAQANSRFSEAEWEARVRAAYEQGLIEGRSAADSAAIARAQEG
ncbi:MAG: hypothetical protein ABI823_13585, partial [Bryobacteraceae bacterium]